MKYHLNLTDVRKNITIATILLDRVDKFSPRITMPVEGFVTVVPVDKMGSRKPQTLQSKEPRGGRAGDWGLRDPSPSTARLRSV